ncbi:MAG TPA: ATP-binding protein [Rhizobiaceae bacterium]|nr:ATP-binding protein [Rhizobiaceae bacterium]
MAESVQKADVTSEAAPVAAPLPERVRVAPPPLAPHLVESNPRELWMLVVIAVLVLAGLAQLSGTPPYISLALLVTGISGLVLLVFTLKAETALATMVDTTTAESRAEIETLADRMWELQESEERFRGLIDALGDLVVHRDREGKIVYANSVFAELTGLKQESLTGKTLAELGIEVGIVPDAAFADGECLSSTDVAIRSATGVRWFSWIELSVRDKTSDAVSHRAIARDITARKRAETALINARERAEHASQAKSRFLATVSHEIRTPMNGIMGMAKLLADTQLLPEQRTYVGAVSTSASALLALIEDLLDYSKIEAGRFELEPQAVSPRELTDNVAELLAARAYTKSIGLGCHVSPDVPALITADPGRLRQVLLNLIGNAIKFTDTGGVTVTVTAAGDADRRTVKFAVADTGPGLKAADLDRIFQEFEQADGTSTRKHGGAGLGLAISQRIVTSMGGTIDVESEPGKGSVFSFEIPATDATPPATVDREILANCRAVIVSKNIAETEAIALTIRANGGTAHIAGTAAQAAIVANGATTLLVDAALESSDGLLLKRLRLSGFAHAEAITLIAPTDRGMLGEFRASGYSSFLARPVRDETLLRMLIGGRTKAATPAAPATEPQAVQHRLDGDSLSILLAEDNDINAMLARATLTKAGHKVDVVGNGRAAVEALTEAGHPRYDVVLMDLHMPVMDGLDAIAVIRRHEEDKGIRPVPIMVLSADSQEKTRHAVLAHGASGFVTKPLDPDALVRAVQEQAAA